MSNRRIARTAQKSSYNFCRVTVINNQRRALAARWTETVAGGLHSSKLLCRDSVLMLTQNLSDPIRIFLSPRASYFRCPLPIVFVPLSFSISDDSFVFGSIILVIRPHTHFTSGVLTIFLTSISKKL